MRNHPIKSPHEAEAVDARSNALARAALSADLTEKRLRQGATVERIPFGDKGYVIGTGGRQLDAPQPKLLDDGVYHLRVGHSGAKESIVPHFEPVAEVLLGSVHRVPRQHGSVVFPETEQLRRRGSSQCRHE